MKTRLSLLLVPLVSAGLLSASTDAQAAGMALDQQSARGTGMAGAMTAIVDDSSSIFYNPAGMARGAGLDAQIGVSLAAPVFSFTNANDGNKRSSPFKLIPAPQAYVSYGLTKDLTVGVGLFVPYGTSVNWPSGWEGQRFGRKVQVVTLDINPSVAYKIGPVRLGAGLQVVRQSVDIEKSISFGDSFGTNELGAGAWAVGANAGLQIDFIEKILSFGAHYRSAYKFNYDDGKAHFTNVPVQFSSILFDQRASTSLTMPDTLSFGLAGRPIESLLLSADVQWSGGSKFRAIDVAFPNDPTLAIHEAKNWHDTVNYHLGAEGKLNDTWRIRGGVEYDPTPQGAATLLPDVPDASRINLALGGSYYHPCGVHVDVGYQLIFLLTHTSTNPSLPGDYSGSANILGLTIGYTQPRAKVAKVAPAPAYDPPPPVDSPPARLDPPSTSTKPSSTPSGNRG